MENEKIIIPKTVYDKEYSTQWRREVEFLEAKGIAYTYAKRHYKYPVTKYKYAKTPELFLALAEFYNQVRNERFFKNVEKTTEIVSEKLPIEKGYIEVKESELSQPEKKTVGITEQDIADVLDETE